MSEAYPESNEEQSFAERFTTFSPEAQAALRRKVDEYFVGIKGVKDHLFVAYFIEIDDERNGIVIDANNVDQTEQEFREHFGQIFPDLLDVDGAPNV